MTNVMQPVAPTAAPISGGHPGVRVDVVAVDRHAGGRQILHGVSLTVEPGELVAVAGGSGAGKSTLLEVLAGLRRPSAGHVLHDGRRPATGGAGVGYVPQDDIIHRELPLRRTLRYAAALRLPRGSAPAVVDRVVDECLHHLDLADRADVRVGALSGGQRKRACIAVELLTRPHLLLLDEPTSGLDPATAAEVLGVLRRLARSGVTVVLTTHAPADIDVCDRVVFLARDGHLAFAGPPAAARAHFGVADLAHAYRARPAPDKPTTPAGASAGADPPRPTGPERTHQVPTARPGPDHAGAIRQWSLLARRSAEVMVRNRLTVAVLLGSPFLVTAMFAVLFRPGAFDATATGSLGPAQTVFWIAFAGFFFGLTYGLLQIVGEMAVLRRERLAGLRVGAYVLAKVTVLTPVLALVAAALLGVLRLLDRLPAAGWATYAALFGVLLAESVAALTLGLLTSAVVADAAQATLALPMLCFPQVLFAGAVVPVVDMAGPGQVISAAMANRWAFESLGRSLELDARAGQLPALGAYHGAFAGSVVAGVAVLTATAVVCGVATAAVLHGRTRTGAARRR